MNHKYTHNLPVQKGDFTSFLYCSIHADCVICIIYNKQIILMAASYQLGNTLRFLKKIKKNNNREWFAIHKEEYQTAFEEMIRSTDCRR